MQPNKSNRNFFAKKTLSIYPGQPRDEITQAVFYKHIISIVPILFAVFILAIGGIVATYYLGIYQEQVSAVVNIEIINFVALLFLAVLVFLFAGVIWIWRRNKVIITNVHIVDIDQLGLFNRKVSTLRLEEIQDISVRVMGPTQTILQYGSLSIQTAGTRENFLFDYIAEPYDVEKYILEIRQKYTLHGHSGHNSI